VERAHAHAHPLLSVFYRWVLLPCLPCGESLAGAKRTKVMLPDECFGCSPHEEEGTRTSREKRRTMATCLYGVGRTIGNHVVADNQVRGEGDQERGSCLTTGWRLFVSLSPNHSIPLCGAWRKWLANHKLPSLSNAYDTIGFIPMPSV
jgi:hypothetical protein